MPWDIQIRGGFDPIKFSKSRELLDNPVTMYLLNKVEEIADAIKTNLNIPYPPPSVGGEAPHLRTGTLQESVLIDRVERHLIDLAAKVPYAIYLEWGTSKMLPRPFFFPVVNEMRQDISKDLAAIMREYFEESRYSGDSR